MKQRVWLSYDLGVKGDYEGIYSWLDSYEADECGDSFATFVFNYESDVVSELRTEIEKNIEIRKRDRVYLVFKNEDGKTVGKFLFGNRKAAPWVGYAGHKVADEDDTF